MGGRVSPSAVTSAVRLSLQQMSDPKILGILVLALVIALAVIGPFWIVFGVLAAIVEWILPSSISLPGLGQVGFLGVFTEGLASRTSWVFWTYFVSPFAVAIIGMLLDSIVDSVEARHYPGLAKVRRRGLSELVAYGFKFLALMVSISVAAWIVYWITGLPTWLIFVPAAGYLVAREYFETVALRRMILPDAKSAMRANFPALWGVGIVIALALNIPFLNLVAPLVGVSVFTHLFHRSNS